MAGMETSADTIWSLATVKAYFKTNVDTEELERILVRIADGVSAYMESYTNRYFVAREKIETHDGERNHRMWVEITPVVSVASLTVVRFPGYTPELVLAANYVINKETGEINAWNDVLNKGTANIVVTYTPGYGAKDSDDIPRDVWLCGLDLIKFLYDEFQTGATGASSVSIGPNTFMLKPSWPIHVRDTLNNWVLVNV